MIIGRLKPLTYHETQVFCINKEINLVGGKLKIYKNE